MPNLGPLFDILFKPLISPLPTPIFISKNIPMSYFVFEPIPDNAKLFPTFFRLSIPVLLFLTQFLRLFFIHTKTKNKKSTYRFISFSLPIFPLFLRSQVMLVERFRNPPYCLSELLHPFPHFLQSLSRRPDSRRHFVRLQIGRQVQTVLPCALGGTGRTWRRYLHHEFPTLPLILCWCLRVLRRPSPPSRWHSSAPNDRVAGLVHASTTVASRARRPYAYQFRLLAPITRRNALWSGFLRNQSVKRIEEVKITHLIDDCDLPHPLPLP